MSDLDDLYGILVEPNHCTDEERMMVPSSYTALSEATAPALKLMMEAATKGSEIVRGVFSQAMILWVIDEQGTIRLGLEEVFSSSTKQLLRPRLKKQSLAPGEVRIGHPSLVRGGPARIGGELLFDRGSTVFPEGWYLTNGSGRFGTIEGRTVVHLNNACSLFARFELGVKPYFYNRGAV